MCLLMVVKPTENTANTAMAIRNAAGVPLPVPEDIMNGTLPVMAVIGAAVAMAMNTTPSSPMALGLSRCTPSDSGPGDGAAASRVICCVIELLSLLAVFRCMGAAGGLTWRQGRCGSSLDRDAGAAGTDHLVDQIAGDDGATG